MRVVQSHCCNCIVWLQQSMDHPQVKPAEGWMEGSYYSYYYYLAFGSSWSARVESRSERQRPAASRLAVTMQQANATSRAPAAPKAHMKHLKGRKSTDVIWQQQEVPEQQSEENVTDQI